MRTSLLLFVISLFSFKALHAQDNYRVLVTAFAEKVKPAYFENLGKVTVERDVNDLYKVYYGSYSTEGDAKEAVKEAKAKGYKYARIIDFAEIKRLCADGCALPLYVRNIFFDFDRSNLRAVSKADLKKLASLLKDNAAYKVEFTAHTDARGSDTYNVDLSKRRAESAKQYLIAQGISADRIKTSHSGENSPIAKNELPGGVDSPTGRQYNRRVEVTVMDGNGKVVSDVVQPIRVPDGLRI